MEEKYPFEEAEEKVQDEADEANDQVPDEDSEEDDGEEEEEAPFDHHNTESDEKQQETPVSGSCEQFTADTIEIMKTISASEEWELRKEHVWNFDGRSLCYAFCFIFAVNNYS